MSSNPFDISEEVLAELAAKMSPEQQIEEASRIVNLFHSMTGAPLVVTRSQMKSFREAGVDCTHLLEIAPLP